MSRRKPRLSSRPFSDVPGRAPPPCPVCGKQQAWTGGSPGGGWRCLRCQGPRKGAT